MLLWLNFFIWHHVDHPDVLRTLLFSRRVLYCTIVMDLDIADDRLLFIIDNDQLANFFPLPHEEWYLVRTPHGRYMVAYVRCTFLRPIWTLHNLEHACFTAMLYSRTTCRSRWLRLCCRLFRMMLSCLFLRAQDRVPTPYMILSYFRRQGILVDEFDA